MRKLWYAGAVAASGFLLFAAAPAQADAQADAQPGAAGAPTPSDLLPGNSIAPPFGDLLSGAGGWALTQGQSAVAGADSAATSGAGPAMSGANDAAGQATNGLDRVRRSTDNKHLTVPLDGTRPLTGVHPAAGRPPAPPRTEGLPSTDVLGPLQQDNPLGAGGLFDQLPLVSGVLPNGQSQSSGSLDRPTVGGTESRSEGMPLLGGLAGALPVNGVPTVPGGLSDVAGLPGGGMAVLAPATADADDPAVADPAVTAPAAAEPTAAAPVATGPAAIGPAATGHATTGHATTGHAAATGHAATGSAAGPIAAGPTASPGKHKVKPTATVSAGPADPRLHEEPIDGEATRTFSPDGRPVAGVDQRYK